MQNEKIADVDSTLKSLREEATDQNSGQKEEIVKLKESNSQLKQQNEEYLKNQKEFDKKQKDEIERL